MSLSAEPLVLRLKTPWRIAHGASTERTTLLVRLGDGLGEGALPPYYPYRYEDAAAYVEALDADALLGDDPFALDAMLDRLPPGPPPARAAVDMALHDHWAQHLGQPLYRLWGLSPAQAPASSLSFGLPESLDDLRAQIEAAPGFPIYKLKLGTGSLERDEAIVRSARAATDARLCVDANGGWTVDDAARIIPRLAAYEVAFIEQPLPASDPEAWHHLRRRLPLDAPPLFADESIQSVQDILDLRDVIDGVNLKLAKTGGLRGARQQLTLARALGLQVMLGCMIESSVALTAAAHLAPLVDYADLDGALHVANDPFKGLTLDAGRLRLPDRPGLGVRPR